MLKVLFLTDHRIHNYFDSVYLLASQLQQSGKVDVFVASMGQPQNSLYFQEGDMTHLYCIQPDHRFLFDNRSNCFSLNAVRRKSCDFDFIFLRILPIDLNILNLIQQSFDSKRLINSARGIIKTESKAFLLNLPNLCPEINLCHTVAEILACFSHGPIVLKPLYGFGGKHNLLLKDGRLMDGKQSVPPNRISTFLAKKMAVNGAYLAMRYLPRYREGDKRLLVVNGKIVGASLRLPNEDSWLCNISSGGKVQATRVSDREKNYVEYLTPLLKSEGVVIYGIDTLLNDADERVVTEINTCCPGGFYSLNSVLKQKQTMPQTIDALLSYMLN